jgi:chromosome partitioning protein
MESLPHDLRILSVCNLKGGAGKTTSAVCLSDAWARGGASVLLVDLDPQGTASAWLAARSEAATRLLTGGFDPSTHITPVLETDRGRLDVVTANRSLDDATERRTSDLTRQLERLYDSASRAYDLVVLDTPPQSGPLVTAALLSSASAVVPVAAGRGSVDGLRHVLEYTKRIGGADVTATFACNVDMRTTLDVQTARQLVEHLGFLSDGGRASRHYVRSTVSVREAEAAGEPLGGYAPRSTAWADYRALGAELVRIVGLDVGIDIPEDAVYLTTS